MAGDPWDAWCDRLLDPSTPVSVRRAGRMDRQQFDTRPRHLAQHLLQAVLTGGLEGSVAGQSCRARAGDLLWVPAGVAHHLRLAAGQPRYVAWYLHLALPTPPLAGPWGARSVPQAAALAADIASELRSGARQPGHAQRLRALVVLLITAWRRGDGAASLGDARRDRIDRLIASDRARRWTTAELAQALQLSPVHTARLVSACHGMPPRRLVMTTRIRAAAADLLADDAPVGEIARRYGYRDHRLFGRQFRSIFGCSPGAWRRR